MPPTSPTQDWIHYFKAESQKPEYGAYDKFDDIPPKYLDDPDKFKAQLSNNPLETVLLIAGTDRTV